MIWHPGVTNLAATLSAAMYRLRAWATATGAAAEIDTHEIAQTLAIITATAFRLRRHLIKKPSDHGKLGKAMTVGKEAIIPNAMEAIRQAVEQEAVDELVGVEHHHFRLVVLAVIAPPEADPGLVHGDEPTVGDGNPVCSG